MKFKKIMKEYWFIPVIVVMVSAINLFICRIGLTVGDSMNPTLKNNEPILISVKSEIHHNDIIVFSSTKEMSDISLTNHLIKRVIALPGETIQIKDNTIYINDKPIEDAVKINMKDYGLASEKITLKDDEYFVMGDNRNNSFDSRAFGPIKKQQIMGTVPYSLKPYRKLINEVK